MDDDSAAATHDVTADAVRVFESALPDRRITDLSPLGGEGPSTVVAVTTAAGERFVLKYAADRAAVPALRRELAATNFVREETAVPTVEPVASGFDGRDTPGYLITRWAGGRTLDETLDSLPPNLRPQVFADVGETLATLHSETSFETPGELEPTGPASFEVDPAVSWPDLFARRLADNVEALQGTRFETVAEEVWSDVSERLDVLDTGDESVLLHGDIGDGNVVFDDASLTHVLDWERAFVGHPEYDLCRAEVRYFLNNWGRESTQQAMLVSGYRSVRDLPSGFDDRRRCYLATFYLLPLATYPEWAHAFTDDLDGFAERVAEKVRGLMD